MAKNTSTRTRRKKPTPSKKSSGPISLLISFIQGLKSDPESREQTRKIFAWTLLFACIISLVACISYYFTGHQDQSATEYGVATPEEVSNWLGTVGAWLSDWIIRRGFGIFGLIIPAYGLLIALVMIEDDFYVYARQLLKYVVFITLFGSVFIAFIELLTQATSHDLGGGVGVSINLWLFKYVGTVGVAFLLLFAVLLFVVINFNAELKATRLLETFRDTIAENTPRKNTPQTKSEQPKNYTKSPLRKKLSGVLGMEDGGTKETETSGLKPVVKAKGIREVSRSVSPPKKEYTKDVSLELAQPTAADIQKKAKDPKAEPQLELTIVAPEEEPALIVEDSNKIEQIGDDNIGLVVGENKVEKIVPEEDQEISNADEIFEDDVYDPTLELSGYQRPPFELLEDHSSGRGREVNREELESNKNKIVQTLQDYGIKIMSIKATIGPTVTLYEIVPAPGVRISKIKNLEDDIALSLAALGIRIIAPMPGKGTIGIEVPNSKPETVSLRGVLTTEKFINSKAELPIAIGRNISNEVYVADLNKMPHLLIAGATGQGKSVGLNTIIISLLYKKHPAEIKFVLIDPKKVEMSLYQLLKKHFLAQLPEQEDEPIVTDVRQAVNVLKSLCIEMDRRYDLLKKARVRNLKEYNKKFTSRKLNPKKGHEFLPYIVLVIDELADMMMVAGKEVEMPIARLAQLARAVGIHLVVATQRPSVNVITGIIKANFPARMSYRVISKVDSRTILDANGADQLVGRGDLLLSTGSDLIRIQNAFIDTPEVERVVTHISSQKGFFEPYFLPSMPEDGDSEMEDDEPFERDSKFEEAARMIVRYQIGSASLIQRKMKLGYNRAGRIIDQLERAGVVGPHSGSKAREVLVTDEVELERYLSKLS